MLTLNGDVRGITTCEVAATFPIKDAPLINYGDGELSPHSIKVVYLLVNDNDWVVFDLSVVCTYFDSSIMNWNVTIPHSCAPEWAVEFADEHKPKWKPWV